MLDTKELIQKSLKNPAYLRYWLEAIIDEKITLI